MQQTKIEQDYKLFSIFKKENNCETFYTNTNKIITVIFSTEYYFAIVTFFSIAPLILQEFRFV